jgi:hypothetical protein
MQGRRRRFDSVTGHHYFQQLSLTQKSRKDSRACDTRISIAVDFTFVVAPKPLFHRYLDPLGNQSDRSEQINLLAARQFDLRPVRGRFSKPYKTLLF